MRLFLIVMILLLGISETKYYDLALKNCNQRGMFNWTIHGWWPEYNATSWPQFCNPHRFNEFNQSSIETILPFLREYWNACEDWPINSYGLWKHEWEKHGTCTQLSVPTYFGQTINNYLFLSGNNFVNNCCEKEKSNCLIHYKNDHWSC